MNCDNLLEIYWIFRTLFKHILKQEAENQIIQDLLEQNPGTEVTVAAGRQVFWNSEHISESEKLYKAVYYDYRKPLCCQINKIFAGRIR